MNKFIKTAFVSTAVIAAGTALVACAGSGKFNKPETFQNKTGVIGVFRQAAFYCEDKMPQYMTLGSSKVEVKSAWSEEQDNLFVGEMKPGNATLYSYEYTCGDDENKLVLDTADNGKKAFPVAVKVPEQGFCKIVISFLENDNLFSHNDALLREHFENNKVALNYDDVPYCDVIDTKGKTVSFVNRDSLNEVRFTEAMNKVSSLAEDDIYPLVTLDGKSDLAFLSGDNSQVLLIAMHNNPDKYKDNEVMSTGDDVLWAYTDKEFLKWFKENREKVTQWDNRLKQLLGKAPNSEDAYFTVFWANVKDVFRPAYNPDVANETMSLEMPGEFENISEENVAWFKNWFDETKAKASGENGFPWTRLGYTYDWGNPDSKYGLSEFIVRDGAEIEVKFTRGTKGFLNWLKDRN